MSKSFSSVMEDIKKQEIAMVLERRDKIMDLADRQIDNAQSQWDLTVPYRTGQLQRSAKTYKKARNSASLVVGIGAGQRGNLINILNNSRTRRRVSAGFWDRIKIGVTQKFVTKAKNIR